MQVHALYKSTIWIATVYVASLFFEWSSICVCVCYVCISLHIPGRTLGWSTRPSVWGSILITLWLALHPVCCVVLYFTYIHTHGNQTRLSFAITLSGVACVSIYESSSSSGCVPSHHSLSLLLFIVLCCFSDMRSATLFPLSQTLVSECRSKMSYCIILRTTSCWNPFLFSLFVFLISGFLILLCLTGPNRKQITGSASIYTVNKPIYMSISVHIWLNPQQVYYYLCGMCVNIHSKQTQPNPTMNIGDALTFALTTVLIGCEHVYCCFLKFKREQTKHKYHSKNIGQIQHNTTTTFHFTTYEPCLKQTHIKVTM